MEKAEKIWINGKMVAWDEAQVHVLTHALHYGTSVFESARCYETPGGAAVFRLKDHMQRLHDSAKIYMMKLPYSVGDLCTAAKELVRINRFTECYIRPIAFIGYGEMGLNPGKNPVHIAIAAWKWGAYLGDEGIRRGIRCKVSSWRRIDSSMMPPAAKAGANYANSVLAKLEALNCGYDEALMLNARGTLCEGSGENLFIIKKGTLITPPPASGALGGITMDTVTAIARDMGLPCIREEITREELFLCDEAFLTGTAAEITPIREVDGRPVGNNGRGPITEKIQNKYFEIVRGKDARYRDWLDPV